MGQKIFFKKISDRFHSRGPGIVPNPWTKSHPDTEMKVNIYRRKTGLLNNRVGKHLPAYRFQFVLTQIRLHGHDIDAAGIIHFNAEIGIGFFRQGLAFGIP